MPIPSLKQQIISHFTAIATTERPPLAPDAVVVWDDLQLLIFTAGGTISGYPVFDSLNFEPAPDAYPNITTSLEVVLPLALAATPQYRADGWPAEALARNGGCLILEDAKVQYGAGFVLQLPEIVVFYEHILAIAITS